MTALERACARAFFDRTWTVALSPSSCRRAPSMLRFDEVSITFAVVGAVVPENSSSSQALLGSAALPRQRRHGYSAAVWRHHGIDRVGIVLFALIGFVERLMLPPLAPPAPRRLRAERCERVACGSHIEGPLCYESLQHGLSDHREVRRSGWIPPIRCRAFMKARHLPRITSRGSESPSGAIGGPRANITQHSMPKRLPVGHENL